MDRMKVLGVLACLGMVAIIIFSLGSAVFREDDTGSNSSSNVKPIDKNAVYEGKVNYVVTSLSSDLVLWDSFDLEKEDVVSINDEYSKYHFSKVDETNLVGYYTITFNDVEIVMSSSDTIAIVNDEYVELGGFYYYLRSFINKSLSEKDKIYLYELSSINPKFSYKLSTSDISSIREYIKNVDYNVVDTGYVTMKKYLLSVDGLNIYFDNFSGYVLVGDKVGLVPLELMKLLEGIFSTKQGECCSCCPDLAPGESCIAACCSCS